MKRLIGILMVLVVLTWIYAFNSMPANDRNLRSKAVKLLSNSGSCSGVEVVAKSGTTYILSAGHCRPLAEDGSITVQTEDGRQLKRHVIEESGTQDLLLIEGVPADSGIQAAHTLRKHEHIRTFTHGLGLPTFKTEGEIVARQQETFMNGEISDPSECSLPKNKIVSDPTGTFCLTSVTLLATTARVMPGSSGGMVVDDNGQLVGIVSGLDDQFSYIVPLRDITAFLANY